MTESQGPNEKSKVPIQESGEKGGIQKNLSDGWKNPHIWDELCPLKTYRFKTVNESLKDINIKQSTVKLLKTKNKGGKKIPKAVKSERIP